MQQPPSYVVSMVRMNPYRGLAFTATGAFTEDEAFKQAREHLAVVLEGESTKAPPGAPLGLVEDFALTIKGFDFGNGIVIDKVMYRMPEIDEDSFLMRPEYEAWRGEYNAARRTMATIGLHKLKPEAAYQMWQLLRRTLSATANG